MWFSCNALRVGIVVRRIVRPSARQGKTIQELREVCKSQCSSSSAVHGPTLARHATRSRQRAPHQHCRFHFARSICTDTHWSTARELNTSVAAAAAAGGTCRPANVGILAMDMYFPRTYVEQVCEDAVEYSCTAVMTNQTAIDHAFLTPCPGACTRTAAVEV